MPDADVPDDAEPYSATPAADKAAMLAGAHERLALPATPDTVEELEARLTKTALTLRCGQLREQRDEARRERDEALEESEDRWLTVTAARAQAVQATTDADDLRARVEALADQWESDGWPHPASVLRAELWPERAETARVSDSGAGVAPSAAPDLLGPQIGAQGCGCPGLRANVEAVVAPWPPGVRKGDVLRAIGGE